MMSSEKKPREKGVLWNYSTYVTFHKYKWIYSEEKQFGCCLGMLVAGSIGNIWNSENENTFWWIIFSAFFVVMISQLVQFVSCQA
jgi:hypothetical protein